MGRIGEVNIGEPYCSGGAYELTETPTNRDYIGEWGEISPIEISQGWEVFLSGGTGYAVALTEHNVPREEIFEKSIEAVTSALDVYSIISDYHGETSDSINDHILWWEDVSGQRIIELVGTAPLRTRGRARATVNGEKSTPTIPEWNESYRHFRLSLLTDDIFDAYRNQFLAVEYFLSDICPRNDDERLTNWMERALEEAHERYDISNYAPNENNPVASIHGYQYEHVRCGMFHSQALRDPRASDDRLTPREQSDIITVKNALDDLTKLYSHMIKQEFGNSPNSPGGLTVAGFEKAAEAMLGTRTNEIVLTPEHDSTEDDFQIPEKSEVLDTSISSERDSQGVKFVEANADIDQMEIKSLRRSILIGWDEEDPKPLITGEYPNIIDISEFDQLKITKGIKLSSSWRSQFD